MQMVTDFFTWLYNLFRVLFEQNADAILSLPSEVKTILTISLVICLCSSLIKKATRFAEITVMVALAYMTAAYFGFI